VTERSRQNGRRQQAEAGCSTAHRKAGVRRGCDATKWSAVDRMGLFTQRRKRNMLQSSLMEGPGTFPSQVRPVHRTCYYTG